MANFVLKVKTKSGQTVLKGLTPESTIRELKSVLTSVTDIKETALNILSGFPPRPINLSNNQQTLESSGILSGDTLIIEEQQKEPSPERIESEDVRHHIDTSQLECPGILMRKVVPADNSCLFTSIGFVLGGKVDTSCSSFMREIIAKAVANDEEKYSEAILGQPNSSYCKWILKPDSWGGAIELSVLSSFYGLEIAVVDTMNAIINRFGEDQNFPQRVFLMFDGIHYDPLYLEPFKGGSIQTIFPSDDERVLEEASLLAQEAKSSRQYTDVQHFTLQCLSCKTLLTGQGQAQEHAKATGHMNFGEVAK